MEELYKDGPAHKGKAFATIACEQLALNHDRRARLLARGFGGDHEAILPYSWP